MNFFKHSKSIFDTIFLVAAEQTKQMSAIDFARRKVEQTGDAVVEQVEHFGQLDKLEQMSRLKVGSRLVHVMVEAVVGVDEPGEKVRKIEEHKAGRYG